MIASIVVRTAPARREPPGPPRRGSARVPVDPISSPHRDDRSAGQPTRDITGLIFDLMKNNFIKYSFALHLLFLYIESMDRMTPAVASGMGPYLGTTGKHFVRIFKV